MLFTKLRLLVTPIKSTQHKQLNQRNIYLASQKAQHYMDLEYLYGCNNYAPQKVVLERGQGIHLWDVDGVQYMDFLSAYSAVNQGHVHPKILETFINQAKQLTLTSRAFYNTNLGKCEEFLCNTFGFDRALMMNAGVEAAESSIKFARRWSYVVKGVPDNQATVLFAVGNFWGRSIAACGSSEDPDRHLQFGPYGLNFELIEYNDIQALKKKLEENPYIAAYMMEPIQGERGVVLPTPGYLKAVKELCTKHNVLLIFDEIQTGLGRTGKMMCYDWEGVKPDMVCLGKALSGGFMPVSALLASKEIMDCIKPGQHGSTYGGNSLASAVAIKSVQVLIEEKMVENSQKMGEIFIKGLRTIKKPYIRDVRGSGLFVGLEFNDSDKKTKFTAKNLCYILLKNKLLSKPTHENIIRFSPPLLITEEQINKALEIIYQSFEELDQI